MLVSLQNVNYTIGGIRLINDVSLSVNVNDRGISFVGANGCGKSTLMKILAGEINVDAGKRTVAKDRSILLVKQELPEGDVSPIDFLKASDLDLVSLYEQLENAKEEDVGEICERIEQIETERYETSAVQVLFGLGISEKQQQSPMKELSGGLLMRIALASALLQKPDVLLLDEPTNHLDLPSTLWLTEYLKTYPKPFVLISHDSKLLNEVIKTTYHLQRGRLTRYNGNFTTYIEQRELSQKQAIATNENTDKKIAKLEKFVAAHKADPKWAGNCGTKEKWMKEMNETRPEVEYEAPPIPIQFLPCSELSDPIIETKQCNVFYKENEFILSDVNVSIQRCSRIGVLGLNGQGKSTLMRMLMQQIVHITGEYFSSARLRIGYFSQNQADIMSDELSVLEQMKTQAEVTDSLEDLQNHLIRFGFQPAHCDKLVGNLSGGEKSRLMFAMIAFKKPHLIIMDEPTNHLDFETKNSLIKAINEFNGAVVLVSHDWELLEKTMGENTMSQYWLVRNGHVKLYANDLAHYREGILNRISTSPLQMIAKTKAIQAKETSNSCTKDSAKITLKSHSEGKDNKPYSDGKKDMLFASKTPKENNQNHKKMASNTPSSQKNGGLK